MIERRQNENGEYVIVKTTSDGLGYKQTELGHECDLYAILNEHCSETPAAAPKNLYQFLLISGKESLFPRPFTCRVDKD